MKELNKKYTDNKLDKTELKELRMQMNHTSDDSLEKLLLEDWLNDRSADAVDLSDDKIDELKAKIDNRLVFNQTFRRYNRWWWAAAIIIPLLLSNLYFYIESRHTDIPDMIVSTAKGEKANITLPDGTKVVLNGHSVISYSPDRYNNDERRVSLEGEAYFDVVKNAAVPFIVYSDGVKLKVLGTKFNIVNHKVNSDAEIFLEHGKVSLQALHSSNEIILEPNQKAVLNKKLGTFHVDKETPRRVLSWMKGELYFSDTPLQSVIKGLEQCYSVKITKLPISLSDDVFSGTLPTDDILEALNIIKGVYGLSYVVSDSTIVLSIR